MVDLQILLCVLLSDRFGIGGTAFNRFQSYLSEPTQSFVYTSVAINHLPVTCSVPQGAVFGPPGFIAYTEDLTAVSDKHAVHLHMYTDDIQFYDSSTLLEAECLRDHLTSHVLDVA